MTEAETEGAAEAAEGAGGDMSAASRLDLRVARVVEAAAHPNADRLLVVQIDLGSERRQVVAGIVGHYEPESLTDLRIVVVANLEPARLRGEESQGMLLAAENEEALGLLLAPDASPGTRLSVDPSAHPAESITIDEFREHEILAGPQGVTVDGDPLLGAELHMDRGIFGRLQ